MADVERRGDVISCVICAATTASIWYLLLELLAYAVVIVHLERIYILNRLGRCLSCYGIERSCVREMCEHLTGSSTQDKESAVLPDTLVHHGPALETADAYIRSQSVPRGCERQKGTDPAEMVPGSMSIIECKGTKESETACE